MHPPQEAQCKKCKVVIKNEAESGQCMQCQGREHYRCTKLSKQYTEQYQNGTLPFKCAACCLPGLDIAPKTDLRSTIENEAEESKGDQVQTTQDEAKQLKEDNIKLTKLVEELIHKQEILQLEYEKAQEVALGAQKIMKDAIKETNLENAKKDLEIQRLEKENERLSAENKTYKELQSKEACLEP